MDEIVLQVAHCKSEEHKVNSSQNGCQAVFKLNGVLASKDHGRYAHSYIHQCIYTCLYQADKHVF